MAERWHAIRQRTTGNKDDPSIAAGPYTKLPDMLKTARKLGADLVLIDTPPKLDKAIAPALAAATLVLVPTKSSILDLQALEDCAAVVDLAKVRRKTLVILNAVPAGGHKDAAIKDSLRYASKFRLEVAAERLSELPALQPWSQERSRRNGDRQKWDGGKRNHRALPRPLGARRRGRLA